MQHKDIIIGHLPSGASVMAMIRASMFDLLSSMKPKRKTAIDHSCNDDDGWQPFVSG